MNYKGLKFASGLFFLSSLTNTQITIDEVQNDIEAMMYNNNPSFRITSYILDAIADIAELIGEFNATDGLSSNPKLKKRK